VHCFSTHMSIQPVFREGRPPKVCTLERGDTINDDGHSHSGSQSKFQSNSALCRVISHILNPINAPTDNEKSIAPDKTHMWTLVKHHQVTIAMHESAHGTMYESSTSCQEGLSTFVGGHIWSLRQGDDGYPFGYTVTNNWQSCMWVVEHNRVFLHGPL